jgi:hypothetical protein
LHGRYIRKARKPECPGWIVDLFKAKPTAALGEADRSASRRLIAAGC